MGGAIAALYAIERLPENGRKLAGLILSSAALKPRANAPRWKLKLGGLIGGLMARFTAMTIDPRHCVPRTAWSRRTGAIRWFIMGDTPLEQRRRSWPPCDASLHDVRRSTCRYSCFTARRTRSPTRTAAANCGEHKYGSMDSTLMMLEGSYHETLNDLDRDRVIKALIDWALVRAELQRTRM